MTLIWVVSFFGEIQLKKRPINRDRNHVNKELFQWLILYIRRRATYLRFQLTNNMRELYFPEPVEDPSATKQFESCNPTPTSSKHTVSNLKKNLALKFDLEHVDRKDFTNGAKISRMQEISRNCDVLQGVPGGRFQHGVLDRQKSFNRQAFRCRRRLVHRVADLIFTKKQSSRYTLRTLAATNVYRDMPLMNLRGLLVVVKYSVRSEILSPARKILRKAKRLLQCELKSREFAKNGQVRGNTIPVSRNLGRQNGGDRDLEIDVSCDSIRTAERVAKVKVAAVTSRCIEQKNTNAHELNLSKNLPHSKSLFLHVEEQDLGFRKHLDSKRDEIDDIFCSLGL